MNTEDREFITNTIRVEVPAIVKAELSLALKEEIPKIVRVEMKTVLQNEVPSMMKTAIDASNKEMKQFIIEHVSNEINDLAMVTANGFMRVDEEFNKVWICLKDINTKVDSIDNRLIKVEKKVDYIGENYTRADVHFRLEKRVKKLELSRV